MHEAYPPELYLKSAQEMREALARWPEAADNTVRIAAMCDLKLDFSASHLPTFQTPDGQSDDDYLAELGAAGLKRRCGDAPPTEYVERLDWELKVIADKGYSSYFLIVNDFVCNSPPTYSRILTPAASRSSSPYGRQAPRP